jgi:hypothetical protein
MCTSVPARDKDGNNCAFAPRCTQIRLLRLSLSGIVFAPRKAAVKVRNLLHVCVVKVVT